MEKITRKTLLYKSGVEYADYSLNHVEGCTHGCTYPCYAMMLKKRCGKVKDYEDWMKPKIVGNALELLEKEIPKLQKKIRYVYLSFATDPFMYNVPEVTELSLKIIHKLNKAGIKVISISKGLYPESLVDKQLYEKDNEHGITLVSLSGKFQQRFEPFAAPVKERIAALKALHDAGLKTWVSIEPYPTPNVVEQEIEDILEAVAFTDKIVFGKWNYNYNIGHYKDSKSFYNEMAYKVITFCNKRKIDVHIKKRTIDLEFLQNQKLSHKQSYYKTLLSYNAV